MSIHITLQQIKKTLPQSSRAFAAGRDRHRALAPYESVADVVAALGRDSPLSVESRDAIFLAIVSELQLGADALWSSILLVAFGPMLAQLRGRLGRARNEDRDQRVLLAFLEAARKTRFVSHVARGLRLAVQREMFFQRKVEQRGAETLPFDDDTYDSAPFDADARTKAAVAEVIRAIEAEGGAALRDLMLDTYANDGSVNEYVDRVHPELDLRARAAMCDRLRRLRLRTVSALRVRLQRRDPAREAPAA